MTDIKLSKYLLFLAVLLFECSSLITAQINLQSTKIELKELKNGACRSEHTLKQLIDEVEEVLIGRIIPQLFPADSCAHINQSFPSGFYWLNICNELQHVYCSINEHHFCNESDGNWMRIAYLNMSDPSAQCPQGWREVESPIRTCRRQFQTSINSVNYSSHGIPYSKVCGRIIAYQYGTPEAFLGFRRQNQTTIDSAYVDGISITYGQHPRNHIWTFAAGRDGSPCPCTYNTNSIPPPFINGDFFCEIGTNAGRRGDFIDNNPLWDGDGCTSTSTCCEFNNPPWFCKQLPQPTTDDVEIRIIGSVYDPHFLEGEDTPVQLIEIYVQ